MVKRTSRYRLNKQDYSIRDGLKRIDNIAAIIFFLIPVPFIIIGGKNLAKYAISIWPVYMVCYVFYFRYKAKSINDLVLRKLTMMFFNNSSYTFYQLCIFILFFSVFIALYLLYCSISEI